MFSAVEIILAKVSKNREKHRRHVAEEEGSSDGGTGSGTVRRRRRKEEKRRYSSDEESSGIQGSTCASNSEESYSSEENSDSSSRVRKRKELEKKKKSERRKSTASTKSKSSKSGRDRKMSGTSDRSSRPDGLVQEPEARMSRRYKSEELLNASDEETPKLTQSSRALSSLSLKEDQERKVKQKQIFMELKRKQEKERKDQLAEQRRLKQQKEQQEIMNTISQARSTEERILHQVSEINQTRSDSTSQQIVKNETSSSISKKLNEKQWKETCIDSESSEGQGKKRVPVVPPKPRKKTNYNQSSDSLNDFSSRENITDINSLQGSNEGIQKQPYRFSDFQTNPNKSIQSRQQAEKTGFSNSAGKGDKLSTAVRKKAGEESLAENPFQQTRGGYYSSSMPRTQHKGQPLPFQKPFKPLQNTTPSGITAVRNTVNMGYRSNQAEMNSGVVYQVPNHGPAVIPYRGTIRGSPTPSNQTIGDFRRNEVSRTINYGHLAQQRADLV